MANTMYQMTKEEFQALELKLEELKTVKRPEIIERIKIARSYGDLSENSEYDAAKDEQRMLNHEIENLEEKLRLAEIINTDEQEEHIVGIGRTVEVLESDTKEKVTYEIVGLMNVNAFEYKISQESPIGLALRGRTVGDTVHVETPDPKEAYDLTILSVNKTVKK